MKNNRVKQIKARAEARPKKIMSIAGWDILVDERNYITRKKNTTYYFNNLESGLASIAEDLEKSLMKENLVDTAKALKQARKEFLIGISKAVHSV